MFGPIDPKSEPVSSVDPLDRVAIGYLSLPLLIFIVGWFQWWIALPLVACTCYSLRSVVAKWSITGTRLPLTSVQLVVAVVVGCGWSAFGGTDHLLFANADWHIRDAVLHDLVTSRWPVGYGLLDGKETLLRAPVAYYLPAALVGKIAGLPFAHVAMAIWTALGASLFLLQVLSLTPSRVSISILVAAVVVFFSGFDIIGSLLNDGPRFRSDWNITTHLEWWAGTYQYSSMTTQLFWVPNHALGGWLMIGLLYRDDRSTGIDTMLPILVVASALWSPLTAIGLVPFIVWKAGAGMIQGRWRYLLHPKVWAPALIVCIPVAAFLTLDPSAIRKGLALANDSLEDVTMDLLRQAQFFLLEAGIIGLAILLIRRSSEVALALAILAVLPFAYLGPGNDLVMRASIPSLAVLAIGACLALVKKADDARGLRKKVMLGGLLAIGAVTSVAEFARAIVLPAWPINMRATLIGASCGGFAPHYVAKLSGEKISLLMLPPTRLPLGPQGSDECDNPGFDLMWRESPLTIQKRNRLRPISASKRRAT